MSSGKSSGSMTSINSRHRVVRGARVAWPTRLLNAHGGATPSESDAIT
jgi:hypothetical protein